MEKIIELPRDNSRIQVVAFDRQAGSFLLLAMGDGEGGEGDINGKNIF